jgi:hypothetical protein
MWRIHTPPHFRIHKYAASWTLRLIENGSTVACRIHTVHQHFRIHTHAASLTLRLDENGSRQSPHPYPCITSHDTQPHGRSWMRMD